MLVTPTSSSSRSTANADAAITVALEPATTARRPLNASDYAKARHSRWPRFSRDPTTFGRRRVS